jgi:N-methylhydantoinase A
VTDANLVLGRLDPEDFLGGDMKLDLAAARRVVQSLADRLGMGLNETAAGILTILNANMANAIRSRTVQKGIDPRSFALVAMGGAGPLHGAEVAAMMGIPEVIVPPYPGITSAMGLLTTDLKYDLTRTQFQTSGAIDLDRLNRDLAEMEAELRAQLTADRVAPDKMRFTRIGDLRYVGQGYELKIAIPDGAVTAAAMDAVWADFHTTHAAEYGHSFLASPIELVNIRVSGIGAMPSLGAAGKPAGGSLEAAKVRIVQCVFRIGEALESFDTPVYRRSHLPVDTPIPGPAIFLQKDSTTVVPPGTEARVHATGSILIRIGGEK